MTFDWLQEPRLRDQLSAWLRPLAQVHPNFGSATSSLTRFFKERAAAAATAPPPPPKPAPSRPKVAAFGGVHSRAAAGRSFGRLLGLQVLMSRCLVTFIMLLRPAIGSLTTLMGLQNTHSPSMGSVNSGAQRHGCEWAGKDGSQRCATTEHACRSVSAILKALMSRNGLLQ